MTNRLTKPDTEADIALRGCLEDGRSFVMIAGAGSGKTTSLIKALGYIRDTQGAKLRERGQKVACITYTEIATEQIFGDVGNDPLFHVSTIHSFLWSLIRPFQPDIHAWVGKRIEERLSDLEVERLGFKSGTRTKTREKNAARTERYQSLRTAVGARKSFTYGTGSDYGEGILGHDDIIRLVPELIQARPLLRKIIARKYPFFFVDESQDTLAVVVDALKAVGRDAGNHFCLGFFGDPMQKIYSTGIGRLDGEPEWEEIKKPENFRCPAAVLSVINNVRQPVGDLVQTLGRPTSEEIATGSARIFVLPADQNKDASIAKVRGWTAQENGDPLWTSEKPGDGVKMLVLVHRAAAMRLGFGSVYAALHDGTSDAFKTGLAEGTLWVVKPFLDFLLPLAEAAKGGKHEVIAILRSHSSRLHPLQLTLDLQQGRKVSETLLSLKDDVSQFARLLDEGSTATVLEVLQFVKQSRLVDIDGRFAPYIAIATGSGVDASLADGDEDGEDGGTWKSDAMRSFLETPAVELWGYRKYIGEETLFSTQHGTKGDEFARVLLVLDDEESNYNLYSYEKLFGIKPLSAKDLENQAGGKETVVERTRRLFYVCCSRSFKDLAVVLFTHEVDEAVRALRSLKLFEEHCIMTAEGLDNMSKLD